MKQIAYEIKFTEQELTKIQERINGDSDSYDCKICETILDKIEDITTRVELNTKPNVTRL